MHIRCSCGVYVGSNFKIATRRRVRCRFERAICPVIRESWETNPIAGNPCTGERWLVATFYYLSQELVLRGELGRWRVVLRDKYFYLFESSDKLEGGRGLLYRNTISKLLRAPVTSLSYIPSFSIISWSCHLKLFIKLLRDKSIRTWRVRMVAVAVSIFRPPVARRFVRTTQKMTQCAALPLLILFTPANKL